MMSPSYKHNLNIRDLTMDILDITILLAKTYIGLALLMSMLAWGTYAAQPNKFNYPLIKGFIAGFTFPAIVYRAVKEL